MPIRDNIGLILNLTVRNTARERAYYRELAENVHELIVIADERIPYDWTKDWADNLICYAPSEGSVTALNKAISYIQAPLCLHLANDEQCDIRQLPNSPAKNMCWRTLIEDQPDGEHRRKNYQIRLFPTQHHSNPFAGFAIPDLSGTFLTNGWILSDEIIPIQKRGSLFHPSDIKQEAAQQETAKNADFWRAHLASENRKFAEAEALFRQLIKHTDLPEWNYLAALNGLANALAELHRLTEAAEIARQSLSHQPKQRAPYLLLFKIHQLSGQTEQGYALLDNYLNVLKHTSRANLDVYLPRNECHFLMADIAFKEGKYKRAFAHYEEFYALNEGDIGLPVLEKLFIYAIELEDYEKSVKYFDDIFGEYLPDNLTDDMSARLLESLSLFKDNGWYDFVNGIYEQLVTHNPDNNQLLHGWISTLIKNEEIEKAQAILAES